MWLPASPTMWSTRVRPQFSVAIARARSALRVQIERDRQRGADRAAVGDRDDVAPGVFAGQARDHRTDPLDHLDEALAARRRLDGRGMPEAVPLAVAALVQFVVGQPLPVAEVLLRQIRLSSWVSPCQSPKCCSARSGSTSGAAGGSPGSCAWIERAV
jgi:hypothetical protein